MTDLANRPLPPGFPRLKGEASQARKRERSDVVSYETAIESAAPGQVATRFKTDRQQGNSEAHLVLIRQCPCLITAWPAGNDPHHLRCTAERGFGLKSLDRSTLPMTRAQHEAVHGFGSKRETEWFAAHGIPDPHAVAKALWDRTGNLLLMRTVCFVVMLQTGRPQLREHAELGLIECGRPDLLEAHDQARKAGFIS